MHLWAVEKMFYDVIGLIMKKFFLLLAMSAFALLFSCEPVEKNEDPDVPGPAVEYDVEFTAQKAMGIAIPPELAGWLVEIETDCHLLALNLSDNGVDEYGFDLPNSNYFIVGLFYDVPDGSDEITVGDGVYEYVPGDSSAGNIVVEVSYYARTGDWLEDLEDVEYLDDWSFTDAKLTVSTVDGVQRFDLEAVLEDGRTAHAQYVGNVTFDEVDPGDIM